MNEMKNVYGSMMSKQAFFAEINKLHEVAARTEMAHVNGFIDYAANEAYNRIVINGKHRPENFGEVLQSNIEKSRVSNEVKKAYMANCWRLDERRGDCFEFPRAADLWAQF